MANVGQLVPFPSQAVSDSKKRSKDYGLEVARAIEAEWFRRDGGQGRFTQTRDEYHRLRLYARGEQSIRKYKDELSIDGDLSYLNLDWKPVPIIPKFVDIVVNGMSDRLFDVQALAQDPIATDKRTKYVEMIQEDMEARDFIAEVDNMFGMDVSNVPGESLPENSEELELYMQIGYKQGIEIAMEQAINNVFMSNSYDELRKRMYYDLVIIGISCMKHTFNNTDGIKLEYVDPADIIYSYTEDPNFEDCYYFGEVKRVRANELKKEFPHLSDKQLEEVMEKGKGNTDYNIYAYDPEDTYDTNTFEILYFNYKTFEKSVYKIKETGSGAYKALEKDDSFNPPKDQRSRFERVAQSRECVYEGAYIMGSNEILKWEKAKNMVRPSSNVNKVMMNYVVSAPRLYKGKIESLVSRITTYADLIQLTHLKLQQVVQRMTPSGIYVDADGLAEIDLGNGTNYNPKEAINMYFQTGSIIGRSMTSEGEFNHGKIPIQELPGGGGQQIQQLIGTYQYYLQMIRDVSGLNEASDGSDPDQYALVGVQKLAAANSNTATRHILQGGMYITARLADAISIRFQDVLEFHPTKEKFIGAIGRFSVGSLEELEGLHHHDFGIFLEIAPDEEEKQMLENNIQQALSKDQLGLEDAIDIRQIKNLKLANQLLKYRKKQKIVMDQQLKQQEFQAQAEANAQAATASEQAKAQSEQVKNQSKGQLSQLQVELDIKKLEAEKEFKKELMYYEFELNTQMQGLQTGFDKEKTKYLEDRKDDRTKIQATQQSKMIKQRDKKGGSIDFESSGNDVLGGIGLEQFSPK